jgi:hypothetical protein
MNAIRSAWHECLQEIELARNYDHFDVRHFTPRNPILDGLLPSLLLLRALSILDDAFESYIDAHSIPLPPKFRPVFHDRIQLLAHQGLLPNARQLHAYRDQRNSIAHQSTAATSWKALDAAVAEVHSALHSLGVVGERPVYGFFAESDGLTESDEPGILGTMVSRFGLKRDGKKAVEYSWRTTIHDEKTSAT